MITFKLSFTGGAIWENMPENTKDCTWRRSREMGGGGVPDFDTKNQQDSDDCNPQEHQTKRKGICTHR